jgi:hypothetical protein
MRRRMRKMSRRERLTSEGYDARPYDMRPLISGQRAFPLAATTTPNPPFAAAKTINFISGVIAAGAKVQPYQNSLSCQSIVIANVGFGDLIGGYDGVNLTGAGPNAFVIPAGAGLVVPTEDAIHLWLGSVAGTVFSLMVVGLSVVKQPGQ